MRIRLTARLRVLSNFSLFQQQCMHISFIFSRQLDFYTAMESPLPIASIAYTSDIFAEIDRWRTAILLAKHCELTGESRQIDWPRIRLVLSLCLKEQLAQSEFLRLHYALSAHFRITFPIAESGSMRSDILKDSCPTYVHAAFLLVNKVNNAAIVSRRELPSKTLNFPRKKLTFCSRSPQVW